VIQENKVMPPTQFDPGGPIPLLQRRIVEHVGTRVERGKESETPRWWLVAPRAEMGRHTRIPEADRSDISSMCTPLRPRAWEWALEDCPAREEVTEVLGLINRGADIRFTGDREKTVATGNLRSASTHPAAVDEYLREELQAGRIEGPFDSPEGRIKRVVPLGTVPKDGGTRRIILNYSAPEGDAVNEQIHKLECQLQTFDKAMLMVAGMPLGTKLLKIDVKSAFRLVPVRHMDVPLLGMEWQGAFYRDKCLPFGLASSPPLWERLSRALEWVIRHFVTDKVTHYVDDFLVAIHPDEDAEAMKKRVLAIFEWLGVPVSVKKLIGPTTRLDFLGVTVDTIKRCCEVAEAKRARLLGRLHAMLRQKWVQRKKLESVVGLMQFVTNVIRPGRAFLARLRHSLHSSEDDLIKLGPVGKADVHWWLRFLPKWPGRSYLVEDQPNGENSVAIVTDACKTGWAALLGDRWLGERWSEEWLTKAEVLVDVSMPFLELAAVVIALNTWSQELTGKVVVVYCDCLPAVEAARTSYSPKMAMMNLLRAMTAISILHSLRLVFVHIPTHINHVADLLSRNKLQDAREEYPWIQPLKESAREVLPTC
jgi:hypothetical protein